MNIDILKEKIKDFDKDISLYKINYKDIIFEERVKINCFYCNKYNKSWTCPPNIPNLDYLKILNEYSNMAIVGINLKIDNNFNEIRSISTNKLHKSLLYLEEYLWNNNNSLSISFIGGSCKLCKDGCAKDGCRQKSLARIPVEALGINVIETLKHININIEFPIKNNLSRYGMILW